MSCGQGRLFKLDESKPRRWGRRSWQVWLGKRKNLAGSEPGKPQQVEVLQQQHNAHTAWESGVGSRDRTGLDTAQGRGREWRPGLSLADGSRGVRRSLGRWVSGRLGRRMCSGRVLV